MTAIRKSPLAVLLPLALSALLVSCAGGGIEIMQDDIAASPPPFTVVYLIHGDANYLFHDTAGVGHNADEEAVAEAETVARRSPQSEVFIFHQKPVQHTLLVFPADNGAFAYFRHGREVARGTYRWAPGVDRFKAELALYQRFRTGGTAGRVLVYAGHQIPEAGGLYYDASFPEEPFTIDRFASALEGFAGGRKLDLVVLSTCNNGTPGVLYHLAPLARYVVASPEDLHLSYIDTRALERLSGGRLTRAWQAAAGNDGGLQGNGAPDGQEAFDAQDFAHAFAEEAFQRLARTTETMVTLAVYDMEKVAPFLNRVRTTWGERVAALRSGGDSPVLEYYDCRNDPELGSAVSDEGVTVYYRPPRFGPRQKEQSHSGWGCWKQVTVAAGAADRGK